ncbi:katanin p80 WD40 repeat-containing subunit B1 homolog KTN80.1-like isoform X2 [Alnus glutinosa]|nr:katanin p80 WD40 repeat-containing subunit B1 homolog KTN80.1-like isoform X2 [Alnus glutinosa]
MDTNLKIWDIRKKGCIHTYKGHTRGVSTIKFSPDGRWVVSGGFDNVVKVWDLTAGKLLHDFKFHEGHIRSIDFHPLEFLLATGSADRTVKFWDLETFELIGSTRPEATGVRAITFHPDGRTLFSGVEDSLKVYSWEPVICHDAVDMGWSTLGDLCIHDEKLLACTYYQNSIGVWAADISLIEPYGANSTHDQNDCTEQKTNLNSQGSQSSEKVGSGIRSTLDLRRMSPDYETKEIKNIYVDSTGGKPVASQRVESDCPKKEPASESKEISCLPTQKQSPAIGLNARSKEKALDKSFVVPSIVPRDSPDGKDGPNSRKECITFSRTKRGMLLKPAHTRRPSNSKIEVERQPEVVESETLSNVTSKLDGAICLNFQSKLASEDGSRESYEEKHSNIKGVAENFEKNLSPQTPSNQESCDKSLNCSSGDKSLNCSKGISPVKIVNGVAVIHGRTRSLVERFERRERFNSNEDQASTMSHVVPETDKKDQASTMSHVIPETDKKDQASTMSHVIPETDKKDQASTMSRVIPEMDKTPTMPKGEPQTSGRDSASANYRDVTEDLMQTHEVFLSTLRSRLTKLQVVRHFWERNDTKGAISALRKLPDHSVQADVISVLTEKTEILTLDLFSCMLPVLLGLLDSKVERHASVSLEMLLKLVAVFGPVISSTISAPRAVGVNLQAEKRLECCNQCFIQMQKIQKVLPALVRKGGLLARCAQELNLVLQES